MKSNALKIKYILYVKSKIYVGYAPTYKYILKSKNVPIENEELKKSILNIDKIELEIKKFMKVFV